MTNLDQFVSNEIETWGFDYIESLFDRGYTPILTDRGWRWIAGTADLTDSPGSATMSPAPRSVTPVHAGLR